MNEANSERSYLARVKAWKIRNMIEGYLLARQMFQRQRRTRAGEQHLPSFDAIKKISDMMHQVKEDHHLVFLRAGESSSRHGQHKFVPGYAETAFIDHVGLLFHQVMAARELRYILEHYAHDERHWEVHYQELLDILQRIETLFGEGPDLVANLVRAHSDNVLLLAFILENHRLVGRNFNLRPSQVLPALITKLPQGEVYLRVGQYYQESGWYERALEAARKAADKLPGEERALKLLQQVEKKANRLRSRSVARQKAGSESRKEAPAA